MTNNLNKFYNSREEVINSFRDYIEMLSDAKYNAKQNKTKEQDLKYYHQNKCFIDCQ